MLIEVVKYLVTYPNLVDFLAIVAIQLKSYVQCSFKEGRGLGHLILAVQKQPLNESVNEQKKTNKYSYIINISLGNFGVSGAVSCFQDINHPRA